VFQIKLLFLIKPKILLKEKSGAVNSIAKAIDYLDFEQFSKPIHKYYLCYPKSK